MIQETISLYEKTFHALPEVEALPQAGSDRRYFRLRSEGGPTVVATVGDDTAENNTFIALARKMREAGVGVPQIYAVSDTGRCYLQEDLGDTALLSLLRSEERMLLAQEALRRLAEMQTVDERVWKPFVTAPDFSRRMVMWDLNYFKYEFVKPAGIVVDEERLEDDFEAFAAEICQTDRSLTGFMYRDFQSRNIMAVPSVGQCLPDLRFIDFQGGRRGPVVYDAVSFLWQAKAGFTEEERRCLMEVYARRLSELRGIDPRMVIEKTDVFALLRTLQVIGAYGLRGLVERRAHFIESLPAALANLRMLLERGVLDAWPELKKTAQAAAESRFARRGSGEGGGLTVKVFSFSYKKGYPEDLSGNGGGFMFDCRGMHNPGRYAEYKPLTGLDAPVREFLEEKGEVQTFVERALEMVSPSVERYLSRGFDSLQVGFGCTGGRHRSVYCAQRFAEQTARMFPGAKVELFHREQGIRERFN